MKKHILILNFLLFAVGVFSQPDYQSAGIKAGSEPEMILVRGQSFTGSSASDLPKLPKRYHGTEQFHQFENRAFLLLDSEKFMYCFDGLLQNKKEWDMGWPSWPVNRCFYANEEYIINLAKYWTDGSSSLDLIVSKINRQAEVLKEKTFTVAHNVQHCQEQEYYSYTFFVVMETGKYPMGFSDGVYILDDQLNILDEVHFSGKMVNGLDIYVRIPDTGGRGA